MLYERKSLIMSIINPDLYKVHEALDIIVGKWKPIILLNLLKHETMRFSELKRSVPDISQKVLTKNLRELEEEDIVKRVVYPEVPPKVEYSVTEYGQTLESILVKMHEWGDQHRKRKKDEISI